MSSFPTSARVRTGKGLYIGFMWQAGKLGVKRASFFCVPGALVILGPAVFSSDIFVAGAALIGMLVGGALTGLLLGAAIGGIHGLMLALLTATVFKQSESLRQYKSAMGR